jgi:nitrite reductase/ring-hydroxylating ferredoxin subunit
VKALTRGEVRKTLKKLRALGVKPPSVGYCVTGVARDPSALHAYTNYDPHARVELCRYARSRYIPNDTGYQIVTTRRDHGLFGARRGSRR